MYRSFIIALRTKAKLSISSFRLGKTHQEKLSVYHATTEMMPTSVEKKIRKQCLAPIATAYEKKFKVHGGVLYECTFLKVFGTQYFKDQYVLLDGSTNKLPCFGKIKTLLCCEKKGYLIYFKTSSKYCCKSDLFIINVQDQQEITAVHHLADYHPLQGSTLL